MHAIAHEGCTDTIKESAQKVGTGRKIPFTGESNRALPTFSPQIDRFLWLFFTELNDYILRFCGCFPRSLACFFRDSVGNESRIVGLSLEIL